MTASKILENLYLGSADDADMMQGKGYTFIDVRGYVERNYKPSLNWRNALWLARQISAYRKGKIPVLVYCAGGIERSPLVVVAYLMDYHDCNDIDKAYDFVIEKRGCVQRRADWFEIKPVEFTILPPSKIPDRCWFCEELMGSLCRLGLDLNNNCGDFNGPKDLPKREMRKMLNAAQGLDKPQDQNSLQNND